MVWQEAGSKTGLNRGLKDGHRIERAAQHYTLMYQIWMRPGLETNLQNAWRHQETQLSEVGIVDGWVNIYEGGRCEAFLVWQSRSHWEEAGSFCHLLEDVFQQLGQSILGWYSPVVAVEHKVL